MTCQIFLLYIMEFLINHIYNLIHNLHKIVQIKIPLLDSLPWLLISVSVNFQVHIFLYRKQLI